MPTSNADFTETLKRLLRVPRHEVEVEERKWQDEREKREAREQHGQASEDNK